MMMMPLITGAIDVAASDEGGRQLIRNAFGKYCAYSAAEP